MKGRPKGKNVSAVAVTMPNAFLEALQKIGKETGAKVSAMVTLAVGEWLKNQKINVEVKF